MQESPSPLRALLDAIPSVLVAVNRHHRVNLLNAAAEKHWNLPAEAAVGWPLAELLAASPSDTIGGLIDQVLATGEAQTYSGIVLTTSHGQERATLHFSRLAVSHTDEPLTLICLQPSESTQRLRQLESLSGIGEIAAGTIHEIRNPLTSINGFIQLLKARAGRAADETAVTYCKLIGEEITHINHILSDFLALTKPQDDRFEPLNVLEVVNDVLRMMYGEALLANIRIDNQLPTGLATIDGSREKIKEVFINLVRNAFQAMPGAGLLTVWAELDEQRVLLHLKDTGQGIPHTILREIFKPFFTTKPSGTGLGLAICQQIVQEHHGEIRVDSVVGQGTTFSVFLPLRGTKNNEAA